jgi:hypothetical protein
MRWLFLIGVVVLSYYLGLSLGSDPFFSVLIILPILVVLARFENRRLPAWWFYAIGVALLSFYLGLTPARRRMTTMLLSPDEKQQAMLLEKPVPSIDRNFSIRLNRDTIFLSPDEGSPRGSERFLWSRDSSYLLLVGRRFFIANDLDVELTTGESLYFLYNVSTKQIWCNASQVRHERFDFEDIADIEFWEPLVPKSSKEDVESQQSESADDSEQ